MNLKEQLTKGANLLNNAPKSVLKMVQKTVKAIRTIALAIFSPFTWIVVGISLIIILLFSIGRVVGPPNLPFYCAREFEAPNINLVERGIDRVSAIANYFYSDKTMSKQLAVYLADYLNESYEQTYTDNELSNETALEMLNRNENISMSKPVIQYSQDDYKKLIELANKKKVHWTNNSLQLYYLKTYKAQSLWDSDKDISASISQLNQLLGVTLTNAEIEGKLTEIKEIESKLSQKIGTCSSMGTGRGKGRVFGGSSADGGQLSALDMSDLISFLETYSSSTMIMTPGSFGGLMATPAMVAGRQLAIENSTNGSDPLGDVYSSCDRLVAIGLKAMKIDTDFPWGAVIHQEDYMKSSPKWIEVSPCERKSGDVIVFDPYPESGHIAIYGVHNGKDIVYQASYLDYLPYKSELGACSSSIAGREVRYYRYIGN